MMINSIMESISISLNAEFGDDYIIYTESVEQGLKEPCFFVLGIYHTQRLFLGKRYVREHKFNIQYFPVNSDQAKEECHAVAERLFFCLELLNVDGIGVRGTKMNYEVIDGILNFFVNYDMFVSKVVESTPMEEISESLKVKGSRTWK